jgi:hypothetical protein
LSKTNILLSKVFWREFPLLHMYMYMYMCACMYTMCLFDGRGILLCLLDSLRHSFCLFYLKLLKHLFIYYLYSSNFVLNLFMQVGWDESTAGERQPRVSLWEIEPLTSFPMYPSLFPLRLKRPWHPGSSSLLGTFSLFKDMFDAFP